MLRPPTWIATAGLGLLVATLGALPARAEAQKPWDQSAVTKLAEELVPATEAVQAVLRAEPSNVGSGQSGAYYRLVQEVRRIRTEARQLEAELSAGKGHDETKPDFEFLIMTLKDAREEARKMFLSEQFQTKAAAARAILDQLAAYYDVEPLPPPLERQ